MAVPDTVVANADLARTLETSDDWIAARTGIRERRVAAAGEATATLAVRAARRALEDASVDPSELDQVVVATCTPDYSIPGSSPLVQHELGARRAGAMDVNAGCAGFVSALAVASAMVEAQLARFVAVCGADTLSRVVDWRDRSTAVLFGDGAGAVIVGPSTGPSRLGPFAFGADGSRVDCVLVPAGGSRRPADSASVSEGAHHLRMKGQDVFKHACDRMAALCTSLLGEGRKEVDVVVAHQANARILRTVADRLGLPWELFVCNVARYGNTSAASVPIALVEARDEGRLVEGARALLLAFGAGFVWSGGMVRWGRG